MSVPGWSQAHTHVGTGGLSQARTHVGTGIKSTAHTCRHRDEVKPTHMLAFVTVQPTETSDYSFLFHVTSTNEPVITSSTSVKISGINEREIVINGVR